MRTARRMLNGDLLTLDVPDAEHLPGSTAVSVLSLDGRELELSSGPPEALEHYLSMSGSRLDRQLTLRSGHVLRHGRYGGDAALGHAFSVTLGGHELFGFTTPATDLETLSGALSEVGLEAGADGPVVRPAGSVTWSEYRTHGVAQVVHLADGQGYLLDVRRTRPGTTAPDQDAAGVAVRGGRLSRSSEQERHAYAVLEADAFVCYGIPATAQDLDRVATSMAGVLAGLG